MWGPPSRKGGAYFLLVNCKPTSWKCGVVRGPHRCPKIPTLTTRSQRDQVIYSALTVRCVTVKTNAQGKMSLKQHKNFYFRCLSDLTTTGSKLNFETF
jgi:hypothetical protein